MKSGRFLEMRDIQIFKPNDPVQRPRDSAFCTQFEDLEGNCSQPAYGKRVDLLRQRPPKVKIQKKSRPFAGRDLADHSAADLSFFRLRSFRRRCA